MDSFVRSLSFNSNQSDMMEQCVQEENNVQEIEEVLNEAQRGPEKRTRQEIEEEVDDNGDFVTVNGRSKRLFRSYSDNNNQGNTTEEIAVEKSGFVVRLSSKQILPKQFGMAKLLTKENIKNIIAIKYRSPFKVNIMFKTKEDANKLLNCQKFNESEYICQSVDEVTISYGIVRNVDLDVEEKEILEQFKCEYDIVNTKRLRRLTDNGKWVDSSVIRLAFKSSSLPSYIFGYGCRFKVEPYIFPVTQCSGCWRFGHIKKFCPIRKIKCPKCGQDHENCETNIFVCINCKGKHMALDKSCPVFITEKIVKKLMSENNCTYKRALMIYNQSNTQAKRITLSQIRILYYTI
ncbi:unnamed protein product [Euphydryas editha]|uniref:Reverse transcriptase n=1 Tax=Euphydryas editha TaxID=104508 RepID=A0AAU9VA38_EUPED|nr:unnamed protein product [Euphydryas editha]